jgi:hypothetical protein
MGGSLESEWGRGTRGHGSCDPRRKQRILGIPVTWFFMACGLPLAVFMAELPFLDLVGWYFRALVHEMGHTAASWLVGTPAIPALGITAEAATVHGEQILPLTVLIWGALAYGAFQWRAGIGRNLALAGLLVFYPVLCSGGLREAWHLASGHLGELALAALFLTRAFDGGFSQGSIERGLYSLLGWFLIGHNLLLGIGLASSETRRQEYALDGSYGLRNDLVLLGEHFHASLQTVGVAMVLLSLVVGPLTGIWLLRDSQED